MSTTTTGYATDYITFSRASLATVTGSGGLIQWAGHNFILSSEQFDSGNWSRVNTQAFGSGSVSNAIAAPNGTTTADFIAETTAASAQHIFYNTTNFALETSTNYTFGVFAKKGTRNYVSLAVNSGGGAGAGVVYDLNAGAVTQSSTTSAAYTIVSSSISSVGNDWYYCVFTFSSTQVTASTCICLSDSGTPTVQASTQRPLYTGDGVSGLYVWGAHLYRSDLGGMVANTSAYPMYNSTSPKNFVGYTEDLTNAVWTATNLSVTANDTTAPNGIVSADKITGNGVLGGHVIRQTVTFTAYTTYTASIYVKASDLSWMYIYMGGTGITAYSTFNSSTGAVGTVNVGTTSRSITSVGNGWYRVQITATTGATVGSNFLEIALLTSDSAGANTASGSIYVWGAQISNSASLDAYSPNYFAFAASAAYNAARLDFSPTTLAANGYLSEEQRTNLALQSADFTSATWVKGSLSVTGNTTIAPDGTLSADTLTTSAGLGSTAQAIITVSGTTYCWSAFFKKTTGTPSYYPMLHLNKGGTPALTGIIINTTSGTVSAVTGASYSAPVAQGTIDMGGYWLAYFAFSAATTSISCQIYPAASTDGTTLNGSVTGSQVVWGAQFEAGAFPTSYIPTVSSTVTRAADLAYVSVSAFPYSASEGTLIAVFTSVVATGNRIAATLTDSALNNRVNIRVDGGTTYVLFTAVSGSIIFIQTGSVLSGAINKIASAYKSGDYNNAVNGVANTTSTVTGVPIGVNQLVIGSAAGSGTLTGYVRSVTYFPRRLSNEELQQRTSL